MKYIAGLDLDEATSARAQINPLRLFDDKRTEIKDLMAKAPLLLNYLNKDSVQHFEAVKNILNDIGIKFQVNPYMVRGLDYTPEQLLNLIMKCLERNLVSVAEVAMTD